MKKIFSFLVLFLFITSQSQELKDFIIPKGYKKILETKGDLDKDGKDETVIIFNTEPKAEVSGRKFYILKNMNGRLKIWKENSTLINDNKTGFYPSDNKLEVDIKNNCLTILQSYYSNSRHLDTSKYTFRFQNEDFYLIGASIRFDDTCEFNFKNEVNFSTGKVIIDEKYSDCDDGFNKKTPKDYHREFTYRLPKLIKMNEFEDGKNEIKVPNSTKYFNF